MVAQQLQSNSVMTRHVAIADVHLYRACHAFGAKRGNREASGHTEKENASLRPGEQDSCKFGVGDIDNVDGKIGLVVATSARCAYALNKLKWARCITLH